MSARIYLTGLIGADLGGSLSPAMHNAGFAALGMRGEYRTFDTATMRKSDADLPNLIQNLCREGFAGFNVTHPFKTVILAHLDELSEDAKDIGAVNTVTIRDGILKGYNTDWIGFAAQYQSLRETGISSGPVLVLGAGGAGRAVIHALTAAGVSDIRIYDPDTANATALAAENKCVTVAGDAITAALDSVGIVNASTVGMQGKGGLPIDKSALRSDHWIAEVVYFPVETPLVLHARALGCRVATGDIMCLEQAIAGFDLMTSLSADRQAMVNCIAGLLSERA